MKKNWLTLLIMALLIFAITACSDGDEASEETATQDEETTENNETTSEDGETQQPEMPKPDLEGIPEVVAEVNGQEITSEEFEIAYVGQFNQAAIQSMMSGQEVDQNLLKEQVLESMIGQELLLQEADKAGVNPSQEEVDKTINDLVTQNRLSSKEELLTAFEQQGIDEEEVMLQINNMLKVDQFILNESDTVQVSDEELKEVYDMLSEQQTEGTEIPSFDEVKSDIENHIKNQKLAEQTRELVAKIREQADVNIYL